MERSDTLTKYKDITGKKFGRLTALYRIHNLKSKGRTKWLCICECCNFTEVNITNLINGNTKSCGCLNKEGNPTHHSCYTRIYHTYNSMKQRCYDINHKSYLNYGGRGVAVCSEWKNNFQAFYDWSMNNGYDDTLTIDRIDNNKGYEPSNCRWVDRKQQARNRRSNKTYTINGVTKCLKDWCSYYNVNYKTAWGKIKRGIPIEKVLTL